MVLWPFLALLFSLWGAVIIGFNQYARIDGRRMVILRFGGVVPLALLSLLFLPWPVELGFYAVAAVMGLGLAYADVLLLNASSRHGGRLAALYVPLKMLTAFTLWAMLQPATLMPIVLSPWRLALLVMGFGFCSGALMFIRRSDASWRALLAVVPVALLFALGDVVAKSALGEVDVMGGLEVVAGRAVAFLTMTTGIGAVAGLLSGRHFKLVKREVILGAAWGMILLSGLTLLLVTIALAPNPGYVAAITMLAAFWLALYAKLTRGEVNNWWSGLTLLAGAVAVAVATAV